MEAPVVRAKRIIFSRGEENFTARDVMDWALVQGELGQLWRDFARTAECERRAHEQEIELDSDAIDEAAVAFRYKYDLITAEETERWLEDRGASLSEFGDYFARRYWSETYSGDVADTQDTAATPEELDLFLIDLTLSCELDRLAEQMSFRLAAHAEDGLLEDTRAVREQWIAREGIADLPQWLTQLGRDEAWLERTLAAEAAFQRALASAEDEKALERELQAMRLNLTRFELETIEVDSRDAAAEVMACVRSDGMEMEEIADEGRYPFRRSEVFLEDLPADQQQNFLSVRTGALLEPIGRDDGFEVCRVKTRNDPQLSDARIRERLKEQISRRHSSELVSRHIDWKLLQPASEE